MMDNWLLMRGRKGEKKVWLSESAIKKDGMREVSERMRDEEGNLKRKTKVVGRKK